MRHPLCRLVLCGKYGGFAISGPAAVKALFNIILYEVVLDERGLPDALQYPSSPHAQCRVFFSHPGHACDGRSGTLAFIHLRHGRQYF